MKRWGRVAWDGLAKCRGEWLMQQWGRLSWFKLRERQKVEEGRPNITLVEVVKKIYVN